MTYETILALIRHGLTLIGGWLLARGVFEDPATVEAFVGAVLTLVGIAWSIWRKYRRANPKPSPNG